MKYLRTITHKRKLFLVGLLASWSFASAQSNAVSPLTVFGLGNLSDGYFAKSMGIGGATIGLREPLYLNISNPASLSALEYTSLETAISQQFIEQSVDATNQKLNNSNSYFNYFALGFKLKDWWGMSLSISPYSTVGYNIYTQDSIAEFGDVLYEFQGKGGVNQAVFGNGFEPIKNLSVGFNVRYLFGSYDKTEAVLFSDNQFYNSKRQVSVAVSSFAFDFGVQYELPLQNNRHFTIGATYANQIDLNARQNNLKYTYVYNSGGVEVPVDTVTSALDTRGTITLPNKYGVGFGYGQKNPDWDGYAWMITGEFATTQWSSFKNFEGSSDGLKDSYRAALGGFFIPAYTFAKSKRARSYFSKIEYRLGGFYENTQINLSDKQVVNYGLTAGFGLPIGFRNLAPGEKKSTILNFGIVVGQEYNGVPTDLKERYVNLTFGVTLSDQWFQKFKYR